jgi:ubiquinone/menaquinone biosynthesis C-methylase UbiE
MSNEAASIANRVTGRLRERLPLSQRSDERELLDEPDVSSSALLGNLRDLARLNRLPGGAGASLAAVIALARDPRHVSIVDVGTGGGDIPAAFARHGRRIGGRWHVTAFDSRLDVVAHAGALAAHSADVDVRPGDALDLPLDDGSVDIAHASLLLHHLDAGEALTALREMRRVAQTGVVINDLRRGLLAFAFGALPVIALGRSAMTRHDGIASLRRAYTLAELDTLLSRAGLEVVRRTNPLMPRVVTTAVPRANR